MTNEDVMTLVCVSIVFNLISLGFVVYQLGAIAGKIAVILRKLNNSQPDDEGGY